MAKNGFVFASEPWIYLRVYDLAMMLQIRCSLSIASKLIGSDARQLTNCWCMCRFNVYLVFVLFFTVYIQNECCFFKTFQRRFCTQTSRKQTRTHTISISIAKTNLSQKITNNTIPIPDNYSYERRAHAIRFRLICG